MATLHEIQGQFSKSGTLTLKIWVVNFDASDVGSLVEHVNETATVTDIEFEEAR